MAAPRELPENPYLIKAMDGVARQDNVESRKELYEQLLRSRFVIPVMESLEEIRRKTSGQEPPSFAFFIETDAANKNWILVFTDVDSMRVWNPHHDRFITVSGVSFFTLAVMHQLGGMIINRKCPIGGTLTLDEIRELSVGRIPKAPPSVSINSFETTTRFSIRAPQSEVVDRLAGALRGSLELHQDVAAGYLFEADDERGNRGLMLGLLLRRPLLDEHIEKMVQEIGKAVQPLLPRGRYIDMVVLNDSAMLETVRQTVEPL